MVKFKINLNDKFVNKKLIYFFTNNKYLKYWYHQYLIDWIIPNFGIKAYFLVKQMGEVIDEEL